MIEPRLGKFRESATVAQAALLLIREWPDKRSARYRAALQACLAVLEGKKAPYLARRAFVGAATEAGVLIGEGKPDSE